MSNDERFWEAAIAESVRQTPPPDVTGQVLAALADDKPAHTPPEEVKPDGRVLRAVVRIGAEVAIAAGVMFAIGWLTGIVQFGGKETADPEDLTEPLQYAASPDAVVTEHETYIELEQGWLLVTTGSPEVRRKDSKLTDVQGRVLLHAGASPTREQIENITPWLNANQLETNMIHQPKHWIATATLAALVLSGSAILDGQRIEAQDEAPTTEPEWHTVRSVMDIQQLPDNAAYIRGEGLKGAHLEFLADHAGILGLDLRNVDEVNRINAAHLSGMKQLRYLDLRGAKWVGGPEYEGLEGLSNLQTLKVDYDDWGGMLDDVVESGAQVSIDGFNGSQHALENLIEDVPTLFEIQLAQRYRTKSSTGRKSPTYTSFDAHLKVLSGHNSLESLDVQGVSVTELGLAYLAKSNRLRRLALNINLRDDYLFQIRAMTNLRSLKMKLNVEPETPSQNKSVFDTLSPLVNLEHLAINFNPQKAGQHFGSLAELKNLISLTLFGHFLEIDDWDELIPVLSIADAVPVQTMSLHLDDADILWSDSVEAELEAKLRASTNLCELELVINSPFYADMGDVEKRTSRPAMVGVLEKFENLKKLRLHFPGENDVPVMEAYATKWLGDYDCDVGLVR